MKFIKKSFPVLSLLFAFSLSSFSANACTVKVGDFDWDSANIHTAIGSYIMEHGYGCDVEVTKGSTNPILAALIDNQLDIILCWCFVVFRVLHFFIRLQNQKTINIIPRTLVFIVSLIFLTIGWISLLINSFVI